MTTEKNARTVGHIKTRIELFEQMPMINNGWTYFLDDLKFMLKEYDDVLLKWCDETKELRDRLAQVQREHTELCEQAQEKTDEDFAVVREAAERYKSELTALKAKLDVAVEALNEIAKSGYGLQGLIEDKASDDEIANYWATECQARQAIAHKTITRLKGGDK